LQQVKYSLAAERISIIYDIERFNGGFFPADGAVGAHAASYPMGIVGSFPGVKFTRERS
jgi:hypothetical protein